MAFPEFEKEAFPTGATLTRVVQMVLDMVRPGPGIMVNRTGQHLTVGLEHRRIIRGGAGGGITVVDLKSDIPSKTVSAFFEVTADTTNNGLWWRTDGDVLIFIGIAIYATKAAIPTTAISALFEVTADGANNGLWWRDDSGTILRIPSYYGAAA